MNIVNTGHLYKYILGKQVLLAQMVVQGKGKYRKKKWENYFWKKYSLMNRPHSWIINQFIISGLLQSALIKLF